MNIIVTIQLDNLPEDTALETVHYVICRQVAEWLDFDQHPQDLHVIVEKE